MRVGDLFSTYTTPHTKRRYSAMRGAAEQRMGDVATSVAQLRRKEEALTKQVTELSAQLESATATCTERASALAELGCRQSMHPRPAAVTGSADEAKSLSLLLLKRG